MRLTPVDILANWYNDETLPWSAQKAVNCLAETAEVGGTRSVAKTKGLPGRSLLADLGTGAPIRGAEDVEGRLFVVSGTSLFEIHPGNTFTNRGNIPGVGLVSIAHNKQGGTTAANEVAIANGLSGYVYNTDTTVLAQITDDAFPGASTFDYVDGYISFTDPEGRFWGHSALNQATQYSSIDRYDAESAPDSIVSHIVSHREVMVFGTRTTEFFRNTGAATGTFQRVDGTEMEVGIAAPLARARLDNTVYWLGSDGLVYRLAGHSPQRVSTRPVEQAISRFNLANAFAHTWEDRGHQVFYLTFPDGLTFGFDVATSLWHARETYGLQRWGVNTTTYWNRQWVTGDYTSGKLHRLNWDDYTEDGRPLVMECQPGVTHADGNDVLCPYVELFMDTGQSPNPATLEALQIFGDAPDSDTDVPYSFAYSASGGFGIYTFSSSGSLPDGLILSPQGVLSGVTSSGGLFSFSVTVTDSLGNTASLNDTITVSVTSDIFVHKVPNLELRSGTSGAYGLVTSFVTDPPTMQSTSEDGSIYVASYNAAPRVRAFEQNMAGAYIQITTPVDIDPTTACNAIAISADGTYMATAQTNSVWVYKRQPDAKWDRIQVIATANNEFDIKFSPDSEYLAFCGNSPFLAVYRRSGDVFTSIFTGGGSDAFGLAWSGNIIGLATRNAPPEIYSVSGSTVTLLATATGASSPGESRCVWTSDGAYFIVRGNVSPVMRVFHWNGVTFTFANVPASVPNTGAGNITISANGRVLASSFNAGFKTWDVLPNGILQLRANIGTGTYTAVKFAKSGDYPS